MVTSYSFNHNVHHALPIIMMMECNDLNKKDVDLQEEEGQVMNNQLIPHQTVLVQEDKYSDPKTRYTSVTQVFCEETHILVYIL